MTCEIDGCDVRELATGQHLWLTSDRAGEDDVFIDNLPGFPDNINPGLDGRVWVGLVSPRSAPLNSSTERAGEEAELR